MAKRKPERDRARQLYIKKKGEISSAEIGRILQVDPATVRRWKREDQWEEIRRKRGGAKKGHPKNQGSGAPTGNKNAETHGAYSMPDFDSLDMETQEYIRGLSLNFESNASDQLRRLVTRLADLDRRIAGYDDQDNETLFRDRKSVIVMPDGGEMTSDSQSTGYLRRLKLEEQRQKTENAILKLLSTVENARLRREQVRIAERTQQFREDRELGRFALDEEGRVTSDEEMPDEIIDE